MFQPQPDTVTQHSDVGVHGDEVERREGLEKGRVTCERTHEEPA